MWAGKWKKEKGRKKERGAGGRGKGREGQIKKRIKKREWTAGYWATCLLRKIKSKLPIHLYLYPTTTKAFIAKPCISQPSPTIHLPFLSIWWFMVGNEQDWDFYGVFPFFLGTEYEMDRGKNFVKKRWWVKHQLVPQYPGFKAKFC